MEESEWSDANLVEQLHVVAAERVNDGKPGYHLYSRCRGGLGQDCKDLCERHSFYFLDMTAHPRSEEYLEMLELVQQRTEDWGPGSRFWEMSRRECLAMDHVERRGVPGGSRRGGRFARARRAAYRG